MVHHRCTRCKEESYPRHKHRGGVYCDSCIEIVRGGRGHSFFRSFFGSIWDRMVALVETVFRYQSPKRVQKERERASMSHLKAMEHKFRNVPPDPQGGTPGKH